MLNIGTVKAMIIKATHPSLVISGACCHTPSMVLPGLTLRLAGNPALLAATPCPQLEQKVAFSRFLNPQYVQNI
jgi:hypothetical protein